MFSIIVAMDDRRGIGKNGALPWHLPEDLKHFKDMTTRTSGPSQKNAVIMGRKTWESLPEKFRPLPNRLNVVLSRSAGFKAQGALVEPTLERAMEVLEKDPKIENIFVIGGAQIYTYALHHPLCQRLFVTFVAGDLACDVFFPSIPNRFKEVRRTPVSSGSGPSYCFAEFSVLGQ
ncbi:MAG: dihydrofolate reductase [Candidatus Omnitrophota bacterium]|nr:dihydrofolate reductase [Candidatus Omnitrophota bacterium]